MTTAFYVLIALFLWSAGINGLVTLTTRIATAAGRRDDEWFVRLLPVLPTLVGGLTGLAAVPAAAAQLELGDFVVALGQDPAHVVAMAAGLYFLVGTVPGALAGHAFKVLKQTVQGADLRIQSD
jgi:hypothetical protein